MEFLTQMWENRAIVRDILSIAAAAFALGSYMKALQVHRRLRRRERIDHQKIEIYLCYSDGRKEIVPYSPHRKELTMNGLFALLKLHLGEKTALPTLSHISSHFDEMKAGAKVLRIPMPE